MPPQKNSGNRGSKKGDNVCAKNRRFVQSLLSDIREEGNIEDVYVARITKKMGNGRVEAFYIDAKGHPQVKQALIRGSFRGKAKRSVWIETGSIVVIADSGIGGSAEFEIMALLSHDDIRDIRKELDIDPRILAIEITDTEALKKSTHDVGDDFVFENDDTMEEDIIEQEERNKARIKPVLDDDIDIDAI